MDDMGSGVWQNTILAYVLWSTTGTASKVRHHAVLAQLEHRDGVCKVAGVTETLDQGQGRLFITHREQRLKWRPDGGLL